MSNRASSETWSMCFNPQPSATLRLICFAHAGGSANAYATWPRQLPPSVELHAVQLPGRDLRRAEPFARELERLIRDLEVGLAPLCDRPFVLFGHSLGGLLAFEFARARRRANRTLPSQLFVGGARAPHRPADPPIHQLAQAEFIRVAGARYDGFPRAILEAPELLAYFLPVIRADLELFASHRYREEAPLPCPITAFGGQTDPRITPEEVAHWKQHTTGAFRSRIFPGGHFFVNSAREQLLEALRQSLQLPVTTNHHVL